METKVSDFCPFVSIGNIFLEVALSYAREILILNVKLSRHRQSHDDPSQGPGVLHSVLLPRVILTQYSFQI